MSRWKRTQFATPLVVVLGCWGGSAERAGGPEAPVPRGGAQPGGAGEAGAAAAEALPAPPQRAPLGDATKDEPCGRPPRSGCNPPPPPAAPTAPEGRIQAVAPRADGGTRVIVRLRESDAAEVRRGWFAQPLDDAGQPIAGVVFDVEEIRAGRDAICGSPHPRSAYSSATVVRFSRTRP